MKKILSGVFSFFASLIPTKKIILFHSFPDVADNSFAMCRYLHLKGVDKQYSFVWLLSEYDKRDVFDSTLKKEGIKARLIKRISFRGIWSYIRARYVFVSHGLFDNIHLKQHTDKVVNLWHGMPLKLLGASEERGIPSSTNSNYVISTSQLYKRIMAEAFAVDERFVIITGQPRCDLLFEPTDWFDSVGIDPSKYNSIGVWLPTYRKSIVGDIRVDGEYNDNGVSFLEEADMRRLDKFLVSENILLLLKIHPMDALQNASFDGFTNIILIRPQDFHSQLYPLLGACDFLLTDYSSVFIDYQILRKPIGFVMNDIESYKTNRGFYFDDLETALPGPILSNYDSLCGFIKSPFILTNEVDYNEYFDNKSSERICDFLNLN